MAELATPADYEAGPGAAPPAPLADDAAPGPASPPPPETGFQRQTATPSAPSTDVMANMANFFRDPQRLGMAAAAAAAFNRPDVLHWLQRGHQAQQENTMEALSKLSAGDKQGAIDAFNMAGRFKAKSIADGPTPDTYEITIAGEDGKTQTRVVDPKKEIKTLLTPPQYVAAQDREELTEVRRQAAELVNQARTYAADQRHASVLAQVQQKYDALKELGDLNAAKVELAHMRALLYQAQANKADRSGEEKPPKPPTWAQVSGTLSKLADEASIDPNSPLGKPDPVLSLKIKSLAAQLFRQNPRDGTEVVAEAKQRLDAIKDRVGQTIDDDIGAMRAGKQGKDPGYFSRQGFGTLDPVERITGKNEEAYRKAELKKRFEDATASVVTAPDEPKAAAAPAKATPAKAGKSPYAEGTHLTGPGGKPFVVKNGVPVPE